MFFRQIIYFKTEKKPITLLVIIYSFILFVTVVLLLEFYTMEIQQNKGTEDQITTALCKIRNRASSKLNIS